MANKVLLAVAKFVRDLMVVDEQLIRIGRQNFTREEFDKAYIVVDGLGAMQRAASSESFDGDAEVLSLGVLWRGPVTLDFYGSTAYTQATEFSMRMRSQAAFELKQTLGIDMQQPSTITDVKDLTGQQYGERMQIEMVVSISNELDIETLRIDTAQLEIRNEDGVQFDG